MPWLFYLIGSPINFEMLIHLCCNYFEASRLSVILKPHNCNYFVLSQMPFVSDLTLEFLGILKMEFITLSLLMNENHYFCDTLLF
jgi:hypothetical protein